MRITSLVVILCLGYLSSLFAGPQILPSKRSGNQVGVNYFGETTAKPYHATPDQVDFQSNWGLYNNPDRANLNPGKGQALRSMPAVAGEAVEAPGPNDLKQLSTLPVQKIEKKNAPPGSTGSRQDAAGGGNAGDPDLARYSLWAGLNAPMILPADKVSQVSLEQAMVRNRADYARKILGDTPARIGADFRDAPAQMPASRLPAGGIAGGAAINADPAAHAGVFVRLQLDLSRAPDPGMTDPDGDYRNMVAELSQKGGFAADDRFPAVLEKNPQRLYLWGWLPAEKIGDVVRMPYVTRADVDQVSARPPMSSGASEKTQMLLALRIPPSGDLKTLTEEAIPRLSQEAGFMWERTIGIQKVPNSSEQVLIVVGAVPVRNLGRVLQDASVVKMMPSPDALPADPAVPAKSNRARSSSPAAPSSFWDLMTRHPYLILVTLLLMAPIHRRSLVWARKRLRGAR